MTKRRPKGPKYPSMSPDPKGDMYFPRSGVPRPVHSDIREHPEFFGVKKKKPHTLRRPQR